MRRTVLSIAGALTLTCLTACSARAQVVNIWPVAIAPDSEHWTQKERTIDDTLVVTTVLNMVTPTFNAQANAANKAAPLVMGETFTIDSKILSETRRINVYLPPGYTESPNARLPVLYMPDGGIAEDFLHVAGLV